VITAEQIMRHPDHRVPRLRGDSARRRKVPPSCGTCRRGIGSRCRSMMRPQSCSTGVWARRP